MPTGEERWSYVASPVRFELVKAGPWSTLSASAPRFVPQPLRTYFDVPVSVRLGWCPVRTPGLPMPPSSALRPDRDRTPSRKEGGAPKAPAAPHCARLPSEESKAWMLCHMSSGSEVHDVVARQLMEGSADRQITEDDYKAFCSLEPDDTISRSTPANYSRVMRALLNAEEIQSALSTCMFDIYGASLAPVNVQSRELLAGENAYAVTLKVPGAS